MTRILFTPNYKLYTKWHCCQTFKHGVFWLRCHRFLLNSDVKRPCVFTEELFAATYFVDNGVTIKIRTYVKEF